HRDRNEGDHDQYNTDEIADRHSADKKQSHQHRGPDDDFTEIGLQENKQTRGAHNDAAEEQAEHGMHFLELAEKKREHHDPGDHGQLRRLKINRSEMQPAARAINFLAHKFGHDQET